MKKDVIAMVLAGGVGSRLNVLARQRAKPAIVFGAIYRIIDFTMSNIANSDIDVAGVLTQYKPLSLMEHIDNGRPWDLFGRTRLVEILPPKTGEEISDWYKGTADAVYQNLDFISGFNPRFVLVAAGDHIYHLDYKEVIEYHIEKGADATICLIRVPEKDARHFGLAEVDDRGRIIHWQEKPQHPQSNLASMGVYLFNSELLLSVLPKVARKGGVDFARDVFPLLLKKDKIFGFFYQGYWRDVGTIDTYWNTNMDLLDKSSGLNLAEWGVKTNPVTRGKVGDQPATYFSRSARIRSSLIARGCVIEGRVENSVISPGVRIGRGALVTDSVVFHDTMIEEGAQVFKTIVDKQVKISRRVVIGQGRNSANRRYPGHLNTGITVIGKNAVIYAGKTIGKNCIVNPGGIVDKDFISGSTIP